MSQLPSYLTVTTTATITTPHSVPVQEMDKVSPRPQPQPPASLSGAKDGYWSKLDVSERTFAPAQRAPNARLERHPAKQLLNHPTSSASAPSCRSRP
jgi:hypothetical protein